MAQIHAIVLQYPLLQQRLLNCIMQFQFVREGKVVDFTSVLVTTPLYVAILGLMFIPFTMRAGLYRLKSKIFIGTGEDPEMLRRVRGQANFIETVPMALFLIISMELLGASSIWLHSLGTALVIGRFLHYLGLTEIGPLVFRPIGMFTTIIVVAVSSIWIGMTFF